MSDPWPSPVTHTVSTALIFIRLCNRTWLASTADRTILSLTTVNNTVSNSPVSYSRPPTALSPGQAPYSPVSPGGPECLPAASLDLSSAGLLLQSVGLFTTKQGRDVLLFRLGICRDQTQTHVSVSGCARVRAHAPGTHVQAGPGPRSENTYVRAGPGPRSEGCPSGRAGALSGRSARTQTPRPVSSNSPDKKQQRHNIKGDHLR